MNLESDLISLSATGSLFHNIGPLNFNVCLDLDRVRRAAFSLRKLESKMFEKAGGRDLLKYLCINLAI